MDLTLTKIIATVSSNTNDEDIIKEMIKQGVRIFRLNFSHGNKQEHTETINNIRKWAQELDAIVTICLDTKGTELRIQFFSVSEINVEQGQILTFTNQPTEEHIRIPIVDFEGFKTGMLFYVDDGFLELEIIEVNEKYIKGKALNSHRLKNNKKVNFPGIDFKITSGNDGDREDIEFGVEMGIDVVFASFIKSKEDVFRMKRYLGTSMIPLYAKIESLKAIENIDEIIQISDGIMVARGDLGVETGFVRLFKYQKMINKKTLAAKKPVICATQMLESMITSLIPLRAEISDIGNAVLDNYDACMLSGETASGNNPALCTSYMKSIIINAEEYVKEQKSKNVNCPFLQDSEKKTCIIVEMDNTMQIDKLHYIRPFVPCFIISDNMQFLPIINLYKGLFPIKKNNKTIQEIAKGLKHKYNFQRILKLRFNQECDLEELINIVE